MMEKINNPVSVNPNWNYVWNESKKSMQEQLVGEIYYLLREFDSLVDEWDFYAIAIIIQQVNNCPKVDIYLSTNDIQSKIYNIYYVTTKMERNDLDVIAKEYLDFVKNNKEEILC